MAQIDDDIKKLEREARNTRFAALARVCQQYSGNERIKGSHHIFKTPWPGDPRINLQKLKGKAKPYQVQQVIAALEKLAEMARDEGAKGAGKGDAHGEG